MSDTLISPIEIIRRCHEFGWAFCRLNGKVPLDTGWTTAPKPDRATVKQWVRDGHNIGLRTGAASNGTVAVDIDAGADTSTLDLPETVEVLTGSGNRHLYYHADYTTRNAVGKLAPHVDFRGDGGQVVFPGSIHPDTKKPYIFTHAPWDTPIAPLPTWIAEKVNPLPPPPIPTPLAEQRPTPAPIPPNGKTPYAAAALSGEVIAVAQAPEGTRNARLYEAALKLGSLVAAAALDETEVRSELLNAAAIAGLPENEAAATFKSGFAVGVKNPRELPHPTTKPPIPPPKDSNKPKQPPEKDTTSPSTGTPTPNPTWKNLPLFSETGTPIPLHVARHIYLQHPTLVFVNEEFYEFTSKIYEPIPPEIIDRDSTTLIQGRSRRATHGDIRYQLQLDTLQPPNFFDPTEALTHIALQNSMLDIRACTLQPHDPHWHARNLFPVSFDDMAECPRFSQAMQEWIPDDPDARSLLEEFMGLCLIPDVSREKALFLVGEGANGKGRFVRVLENLLGKPNISGMPLMSLRAERTFPTAALMGKLVNICTETEVTSGAQLDEGWIKALISGDTIQVERKGRDLFPFRNVARFIIQSNNPPHISDKSEGFWRRLLLVKFPRTFSPDQMDPELDSKLATELPGILNLAIAGLRRLIQRGRFNTTPAMTQALDGYRAENNPLATWKEEKTKTPPPRWDGMPVRTPAADAYKCYRDWCKESGHNAYSRAKFTREMTRMGCPCILYRDVSLIVRGFENLQLT